MSRIKDDLEFYYFNYLIKCRIYGNIKSKNPNNIECKIYGNFEDREGFTLVTDKLLTGFIEKCKSVKILIKQIANTEIEIQSIIKFCKCTRDQIQEYRHAVEESTFNEYNQNLLSYVGSELHFLRFSYESLDQTFQDIFYLGLGDDKKLYFKLKNGKAAEATVTMKHFVETAYNKAANQILYLFFQEVMSIKSVSEDDLIKFKGHLYRFCQSKSDHFIKFTLKSAQADHYNVRYKKRLVNTKEFQNSNVSDDLIKPISITQPINVDDIKRNQDIEQEILEKNKLLNMQTKIQKTINNSIPSNIKRLKKHKKKKKKPPIELSNINVSQNINEVERPNVNLVDPDLIPFMKIDEEKTSIIFPTISLVPESITKQQKSVKKINSDEQQTITVSLEEFNLNT